MLIRSSLSSWAGWSSMRLWTGGWPSAPRSSWEGSPWSTPPGCAPDAERGHRATGAGEDQDGLRGAEGARVQEPRGTLEAADRAERPGGDRPPAPQPSRRVRGAELHPARRAVAGRPELSAPVGVEQPRADR